MLDAAESDQTKLDLIAKSREAGADERMLSMIEQQRAGQIDQDQMIETILEVQTDPFDRAINAARLYSRANDMEKAKEALAQAKELDPDHRAVLDISFEFALRDKDIAEAQRLADIAGQKNYDEAQGRFYQAQVQGALEQHDQAIDTLRLALEDIPINSEGWRLLGDMLVKTSGL